MQHYVTVIPLQYYASTMYKALQHFYKFVPQSQNFRHLETSDPDEMTLTFVIFPFLGISEILREVIMSGD